MTQLIAPDVTWQASVTDKFPVAIDPKYTAGLASYVTGSWTPQSHFTAESAEAAKSFTVYAVLWPEPSVVPARVVSAELREGVLVVTRPDRKTDTITLTDETLDVR